MIKLKIKKHPYLILTKEKIKKFKRYYHTKGNIRDLTRILENLKSNPLPEPEKLKNKKNKFDFKRWRIIWEYSIIGKRLIDFAIGSVITKKEGINKDYFYYWKNWIEEIEKWDIDGATGVYGGEDLTAASILVGLSLSYDWLYEELTKMEREQISFIIKARTEQFYHYLKPFKGNPQNNHAWSSATALGLGSLAILNEYSESEKWLDYAITLYEKKFLIWGKEDGGWYEGMEYWGFTTSIIFNFAYALLSATGYNLFKKSKWLANTVWFPFYCAPPYMWNLYFGDNPPYKGILYNSVLGFANVYKNEYFQWYGKNLSLLSGETLLPIIFEDFTLKLKSPVALPLAKCFFDIGWVSILSGWKSDDFILGFKSGKDTSHTHFDQNSFILNGKGERFLINSGYYEACGSSHFNKWFIQSKAHNTILINNKGQIRKNGKIILFLNNNLGYTISGGDATNCYEQKSFFYRYIIFLRNSFFLIFDDIKTEEKSDIQWLLHSIQKMKVDKKNHIINVNMNDNIIKVHILFPNKLTIKQHNKFDADPLKGQHRSGYPQFHLIAKVSKILKTNFLTLISLENDNKEQYSFVEEGKFFFFNITYKKWNDIFLFKKNKNDSTICDYKNLISDGKIVAYGNKEDAFRFLGVDLKNFEIGNRCKISSDSLISVNGFLNKVGGNIEIYSKYEKNKIMINLSLSIKKIIYNDKEIKFKNSNTLYFNLKKGSNLLKIFCRSKIQIKKNIILKINEKTIKLSMDRNNKDEYSLWYEFLGESGIYRINTNKKLLFYISGEKFSLEPHKIYNIFINKGEMINIIYNGKEELIEIIFFRKGNIKNWIEIDSHDEKGCYNIPSIELNKIKKSMVYYIWNKKKRVGIQTFGWRGGELEWKFKIKKEGKYNLYIIGFPVRCFTINELIINNKSVGIGLIQSKGTFISSSPVWKKFYLGGYILRKGENKLILKEITGGLYLLKILFECN